VRKNPFAAIAAFKQAFGEDPGAKLVIKTMRLEDDPAGAAALRSATAMPNIELIERTMTREELAQLYARTDAILSLHRAEGFGLTIAEGMLHGLPVIATDWSGNVDFLDRTVGAPVKYRLVPCVDPGTDYDRPDLSWAEADLDDAAQQLRRLRDDPVAAASLGHAARRRAIEAFGAESFKSRVALTLGDP